jgi:hypothetical protein
MFSSSINPGAGVNMSRAAAEVTGITNDMIHAAGVPSFSSIYPALVQQLEGCVIVAHNAAFDRRLITQSCEGQLPPPIQPWLCTWKDLSSRLLPLASHKLADVCGHYGICINSAHRASGDVEALAKALPCLFADAERRHGIRTWGDLQQFIAQQPSKRHTLGSVPVAGAASGASSSSGSSEILNCSSHFNGDSNDISPNPPTPYDARAPCGAHEWDSATRKWNGNVRGPKRSDGRPDMRRRENFE